MPAGYTFKNGQTRRSSINSHSRHLIAVLALILLSCFQVIGGTKSAANPLPFHPGEKFTYQAKWGVIPAGELTLEVLPIVTIQGIKAYHFAMITKTNKVADQIYKVRERQDSYVDMGMTHSVLYTKKAEGRHPRDVVASFDWKNLEATRANYGEKMAPVRIVPGTFDPLAMFFVIRLRDIRERSVLEIPISEGDNLIMVKATVVGRETLEIGKKTYDTYEIIPDMKSLEEQKAVKKGDVPSLKIWYTADARKIPVKILSKARVGYFTFELIAGD